MSSKRKNLDAPEDVAMISGPGGSLREMERKRRQVFRPVLDNPFTQTTQWPFIEPELAENVLGHLLMALRGLGTYNDAMKRERCADSGKRGVTKREQRALVDEPRDGARKKATPQLISPIAGKATVGFNSTVKVLENQAKRFRSKAKKTDNAKPYYKYVFVCKYDITPLILTFHFPMLSYTASKSASDRVKLVQLPRGAMDRLSQSLKVENAGIIAISTAYEPGRVLFDLVDNQVADVKIPWLEGIFDGSIAPFYKPNLAYLSTSAPILHKQSKESKTKSTKEGYSESKKSTQGGEDKQVNTSMGNNKELNPDRVKNLAGKKDTE